MKHKVGDIIRLTKNPHIGTSYPVLLQECADKGTPLEITGVFEIGGCAYNVKIHWQEYSIYADEVEEEMWKCLFI